MACCDQWDSAGGPWWLVQLDLALCSARALWLLHDSPFGSDQNWPVAEARRGARASHDHRRRPPLHSQHRI